MLEDDFLEGLNTGKRLLDLAYAPFKPLDSPLMLIASRRVCIDSGRGPESRLDIFHVLADIVERGLEAMPLLGLYDQLPSVP
jgi:hypothetical protein